MESVYLSRRNLLALLSKLDRKAKGEDTACTIIKNDNKHVKYPQSMPSIAVCAVEDDEYYSLRPEGAGPLHPKDVGGSHTLTKYVIQFLDDGSYHLNFGSGWTTLCVSEAALYDTIADAEVAAENLDPNHVITEIKV